MLTQVMPVQNSDDARLAGVRKSRLSFNFSTGRTRRWLLVQWVSVPRFVSEAVSRMHKRQNEAPPAMSTLLDEYSTSMMQRLPV